MKKSLEIAYLMHVDWNWAKQRPHFLFEGLSQKYNVDLYYIKKNFVATKKNTNKMQELYLGNIFPIYKIPLSGKSCPLALIERLINSKLITSLPDKEYDIIWVTSPIILHFIPSSWLRDKRVIYDCMDDYLAFPKNKSQILMHQSYEEELIRLSELIFTSSQTLRERIESRYSSILKNKAIEVVNNAISKTWLDGQSQTAIEKSSGLFKLIYVGTIGEWLDFDNLLYLLESVSQIEIHLIGPIDTRIVKHPRLHYIGSVSHEKLPHLMNNANAFIMPFKSTELVQAVDPVKIYEYMSYPKPIIANSYQETKKFKDYINLYSNRDELVSLINNLIDNNIVDESILSRAEFLKDNTWDTRVSYIISKIEALNLNEFHRENSDERN